MILPMAMPRPATQTDREVLAGIVERMTFHSADTGSWVLRVMRAGTAISRGPLQTDGSLGLTLASGTAAGPERRPLVSPE
jgi:hypothetical protein